jgi:hypothetical protein
VGIKRLLRAKKKVSFCYPSLSKHRHHRAKANEHGGDDTNETTGCSYYSTVIQASYRCQIQEIKGACLLAMPCCARACISARCVSIIFVERAPGQNTTSKPAPDGMMKVDVWSSKANVKRVSQRPFISVHVGHTKAVSVWTDGLYTFRIIAWFAFTGRVVLPCAAVFGSIVLCAGRVAGVELRSLDVIVGIRIHAGARRVGRRLLEIPRTPFGDLFLIHFLVKWQRVRAIGPEKFRVLGIWVVVLLREQSVCSLT